MKLHRINPAKVVSKYVGETEKNLNEILSQAKSTHSILFFDEADALFSTRVSKVESANDRFVNMETNFLLQQLERYEGIVILATNLETTIDQAFKRRIAYHVVIPFPKPPDRERIWRTLMPARAPKVDIDYRQAGAHLRAVGRAHQERDPARRLCGRAEPQAHRLFVVGGGGGAGVRVGGQAVPESRRPGAAGRDAGPHPGGARRAAGGAQAHYIVSLLLLPARGPGSPPRAPASSSLLLPGWSHPPAGPLRPSSAAAPRRTSRRDGSCGAPACCRRS